MARIIAQKENDHQRVTLWDRLGDSLPFIEANMHADISQRLDLDVGGAGSVTVALTKGEYHIDYDADDDTLHIGCDEADPASQICHAEVGAPLEALSGKMFVANMYYCSRTSLLTQIEQFLETLSPTHIEFFVYEAHEDAVLAENVPTPSPPPEPRTNESYGVIDPTSDDADERHRLSRTDFQSPFDLLAKAVVGSSPGKRFHSSGSVQVLLEEGKFYLIGAAWGTDATCFFGGGHPAITPFGRSLGGLLLDFNGELPRTLFPTTDESLSRPQLDDRAHHQRVTLGGAGISIGGGAEGGDLFILDNDGSPDIRVGTVNVTDAGLARILTNVAIGKVIGGPAPQFFGGSIDPPQNPEGRYAVKVNEIVYRIRAGSPESCRCHRKLYREPEAWAEFGTESDGLAHYDSLEPIPKAAIGVTEGGLDVTGCRGGPFTPDSIEFRVANTGQFPVSWATLSSEPWLVLSKSGGLLTDPGDADAVVAALSPAVRNLCTGIHQATVTISNETNGAGTATREFQVEVRGKPSPAMSPDDSFLPEGRRGGPFSPAETEWEMTNTDDCPMEWDARWSADWLAVSPASGILPAGGSVTVVASLTAVAGELLPDRYRDRVVFRNLTSGRETVGREASLFILP